MSDLKPFSMTMVWLRDRDPSGRYIRNMPPTASERAMAVRLVAQTLWIGREKAPD